MTGPRRTSASTASSRRLCVGISTQTSHLDSLDPQFYPKTDGVIYRFFVQDDAAIGEEFPALQRFEEDDIEFHFIPGSGLSASRNAALASIPERWWLIGDDDVDYRSADFPALLAAPPSCHEAVVFCCRSLDGEGTPRKAYPPEGARVWLHNAARYGSIELLVDREPVIAAGVNFDEEFGLGSAVPFGEEYIFLSDCFRERLVARSLDATTGVHVGLSTGRQPLASRELYRRRILSRVFGFLWPVACVVQQVKTRFFTLAR